MNLRWLLRMAKWARYPPSPRQVKFFLSILVICLLIGFIEYYIGWPSWAQMDRPPRRPRF